MPPTIVIESVGSRGDVEPYVALGQGLAAAGFEVAVATHDTFRDLVQAAGLLHRSVAGDPSELVHTPLGQAWQDSQRNPVQMAKRLRDLAQPIFREYLDDTRRVLDDADGVVFSVLGIAAYHVAEQRGIPTVGAWLAPMTRTAHFRNPMVQMLPTRISHHAFEQLMWQFVRRDINHFRAELGLPPHPWHGPYHVTIRQRLPVVYGFSPTLVPPPVDWPGFVHVTGAWIRERADPLADDLEAFLDDGPPPVYIGFGSRSDRRPSDVAAAIEGALRMIGRRGIVSTGWARLPVEESDNVQVVGETNHQLLFPRCAAIVHHGGAGTTHAAARSGGPSIVVPHWADQFFWAERIASVGAGPRPLRRRHLDADSLALRIDTALRHHVDPARRVGEQLRRERGVDRAVDLISKHLERGRSARARR